MSRAADGSYPHPLTLPTSLAELIARHATNLAHLTQESLAKTGCDLIDQLREAEDRLGRASLPGADALGIAAGLLDQALDVELDGGTQLEQQVFVVRAADLLRALDEMTTQYRHAT